MGLMEARDASSALPRFDFEPRNRSSPPTRDSDARQRTRCHHTAIRIPPRSPQANAYAERWVRTLRHELLDRTIIWNQKQLRQLVVGYIDHYNQHRPHRGINQRAPNDTCEVVAIRPGHRIERDTTCSGLINEYRTAA